MTAKRQKQPKAPKTGGKRAITRDINAKKAANVLKIMVDDGLSTNRALAIVGMSWCVFDGWCKLSPTNLEMYARAREQLLERMAHEIQDIADTPLIGQVETIKADGGVEIKKSDMVEHRRLQIESRKWLLARLMPRKYGDKQHIEHSGKVGLESLVAGPDDDD